MARWACRRRSGPSPGPGGQALARYLLDHPRDRRGPSGCSISPAAPAWSPSRRRWPARRRSRRARSTLSRRPPSRSTPRATASASPCTAGDLVGARRGLGRRAGRRRLLRARHGGARSPDWLAGLARRGAAVLIGDPGRTYLARDRLETPRRIRRAGDARAGGRRDQEHGRLSVSRFSLLTESDSALRLVLSRPKESPHVRCQFHPAVCRHVARSADFYARLLEKPVIESSPTFAMLPAGTT